MSRPKSRPWHTTFWCGCMVGIILVRVGDAVWRWFA